MGDEPGKGPYPSREKQDKVTGDLASAMKDLRSATTEDQKKQKRLAVFEAYVQLANLVQEHGEVPECKLWSAFREKCIPVLYKIAKKGPSPSKDGMIETLCSGLEGPIAK